MTTDVSPVDVRRRSLRLAATGGLAFVVLYVVHLVLQGLGPDGSSGAAVAVVGHRRPDSGPGVPARIRLQPARVDPRGALLPLRGRRVRRLDGPAVCRAVAGCRTGGYGVGGGTLMLLYRSQPSAIRV